MASLSPQGERVVLALLAEQYAELVELREALRAEQQRHEVTREALTAATTALSTAATVAAPDETPAAPPG